jgi:hypothetical protein
LSKRSRRRKQEAYAPDDAVEQTFTAYIVKGNRQVVKREVIASKRFRVDEETYFIKPDCIFLKNIDGVLKSVSYYKEGNPNPYSFEGVNDGITPAELDRVFAEDFYHIVTNLQPMNRMMYVLVVVVLIFGLSIAFDIGVVVHVFL